MPRLCNTSRIELSALMYLQMMLGAARPRCLLFLDNKHENAPVKSNVRVGQAVDTAGQAGSVRNVSGFQTMETPVLLAPGERAVMVDTDKFKLGSHFLEGFVFVEEKSRVCWEQRSDILSSWMGIASISSLSRSITQRPPLPSESVWTGFFDSGSLKRPRPMNSAFTSNPSFASFMSLKYSSSVGVFGATNSFLPVSRSLHSY